MAALERPRIELAIGAPGSGKSSYILAATDRASRVLVWDPMREHEGILVRTPRQLKWTLEARVELPAHIVYVPGAGKIKGHFEAFCVGARAWCDCTILVEELATVSHAGKAPEEWGRVIRESRHHRLEVFATTQRPTESDKTIYGTASRVVVFALPRRTDRAAVAYDTGIPEHMLEGLKPLQAVATDMRGHVERLSLYFE